MAQLRKKIDTRSEKENRCGKNLCERKKSEVEGKRCLNYCWENCFGSEAIEWSLLIIE